MSIKNIKVITRNPDHHLRETKHDIYKIPRNYNVDLHPLHTAREYKLALNAVKLNKVFAKPFLSSLSHTESVSCIEKHPNRLESVFSATVLGQLYQWNIQKRKCEWSVQAHEGAIHNITSTPERDSFFTIGNDKAIRRWNVDVQSKDNIEPDSTWLSNSHMVGFSHHFGRDEFVTCGSEVLLWDTNSKAAKATYNWTTTTAQQNENTVNCIKFNPVEKNIFVSSDNANNIVLYDIRGKEVKKMLMSRRVNSVQWNPMESFVFAAASEDYNCYSIDIRCIKHKFDERSIIGIYNGHISAVTDLCYSPIGKEICTAGYDKTIRIFSCDKFSCRDLYHTKRMLRLNSVLWTADNKYILSASTDHNLRIWKAQSNYNPGMMRDKQVSSMNYANELINKYVAHPEIGRINNHIQVPKHVHKGRIEMKTIYNKIKRKNYNEIHLSKLKVDKYSAKKSAVVGLVDDSKGKSENTTRKMKRKKNADNKKGK